MQLKKFFTGKEALDNHRNMQFSTYDVDNDMSNGNCAAEYGNAGNWYNNCLAQNLNGLHGTEGLEGGMFWYNFDVNDPFMALQKMRWMIR